MNLSVRTITSNDISILTDWFYNSVALFLSSPKSLFPLNQEKLKQELIDDRESYVLISDQEIIGCVAFSEENREISHLYLHHSVRKQKLSKLLIENVALVHKKPLSVLLHKQQREHHSLFTAMGFEKSEQTEQFIYESKPENFHRYELK